MKLTEETEILMEEMEKELSDYHKCISSLLKGTTSRTKEEARERFRHAVCTCAKRAAKKTEAK